MGDVLEEAIHWFAEKLLDYDATKPENIDRREIHFKASKEDAIYHRDILNRDNLINIILTLYARENPVKKW